MPTQIYYSDTYHPDDYHSEAQASYGHGNNSDSYGYCPIYRDTIYSSDNKVDGNGDVSNMSFTRMCEKPTPLGVGWIARR